MAKHHKAMAEVHSAEGDNMKVEVYSRSSSALEHDGSCEDQERQVVHGPKRMDIDPSWAEFIRDKAASGTNERKYGYEKPKTMISRREKFILAVDSVSRVSRKADAMTLIRDLVRAGGRFIAVEDGIDTLRTGSELHVRISQIRTTPKTTDLGSRMEVPDE